MKWHVFTDHRVYVIAVVGTAVCNNDVKHVQIFELPVQSITDQFCRADVNAP